MQTLWSDIGWDSELDLRLRRIGNSPRELGDGRGGRQRYLLSQSKPFTRRVGGLVLRAGLRERESRW